MTAARRKPRRAAGRPLAHQYLQRLVRGDEAGARAVVDEAGAQGWSPARVYLEMLAPAQVEIGALWHDRRITVAHEHLATDITLRQMERLRPALARAGAGGGHAVVSCVEDETHAVGARMLADFLLMDGWSVDYLGAATPTRDLLAFVGERGPHLVALSVTMPERLAVAADAVRGLRTLTPAPRVLVGGAAVRDQRRAEALGADALADDALAGMREARRLVPAAASAPGDYFGELGRRLQALRVARGWTQGQLASAAELDRTYISGVENGKQNPTLGALLKLARALEVPLERLVLARGGG